MLSDIRCRYEREINQAKRPPFRLITEGDTPSTRSMTIVVSMILPGSRTVDEQGTVFEELPSLEVTDGWYPLRASIDAPMARAITKNLLKVGSKLAISGTRVCYHSGMGFSMINWLNCRSMARRMAWNP